MESSNMIDGKFFLQPTIDVAEKLIGIQIHTANHQNFIITATEAYGGQSLDGQEDEASHGHEKCRRKQSCEAMFLKGGHCYIYAIHRYHCLNLTTEGSKENLNKVKEYAAAVLIREAYDINTKMYVHGPGLLCAKLGITKENYTKYNGDSCNNALFCLEQTKVYNKIRTLGINQCPRYNLGKNINKEWIQKKWGFKINSYKSLEDVIR